MAEQSGTGYIYALVDPGDDAVRYIGATKDPKQRLEKHKHGSCNDDVQNWIEELEASGKEPEMKILEEAAVENLYLKEGDLIREHWNKCELLNRHSKSDTTTVQVRVDQAKQLKAIQCDNGNYKTAIDRLLEAWGSESETIDRETLAEDRQEQLEKVVHAATGDIATTEDIADLVDMIDAEATVTHNDIDTADDAKALARAVARELDYADLADRVSEQVVRELRGR